MAKEYRVAIKFQPKGYTFGILDEDAFLPKGKGTSYETIVVSRDGDNLVFHREPALPLSVESLEQFQKEIASVIATNSGEISQALLA